MVRVWEKGDASVIGSVSASIKLPLSRCNDVSFLLVNAAGLEYVL